MARLRAWLEVDRHIDFSTCPFLYETVEPISADGEITEDELDRLALAIERVLPKDLRTAAALQRKAAREQRRVANREERRRAVVAQRVGRRAARESVNSRAGVVYRREFAVRGAFRSAERRSTCEQLIAGDRVVLER